MENANIESTSDLQTWEGLLNDQTALFRKTFARNAALETQVEELERELSVWKAALKTADEDKKILNRTIHKLERSIGSLRDDNPLVLCLIDGDGNIFSPELLSLGQAGGRQAAMILTKGLTDHLASIDAPDLAVPGRGQLWLTIYCNKSGLLETLSQHDVCTPEQFEAFVLGFNQASPLFSIVDVGNGKEAADTKIKECLRVFTRFPQTSKVFFGGAHDNGYTSTLTYLENEGLLEKVILLRGYSDLAYEIKGLELPHLEIQGLFLTKRLYSHSMRKGPATNHSVAPVQPQDFDKFRVKTSASSSRESTSPTKKPRYIDPDQPLHKQRPMPCNFYYLAECKQGQNCRFAHDYVLLPDQLTVLRDTARKWPCPYANRGLRCHLGDNCIMGHTCPRGARCSYAKQGKCKFITKDAHGTLELSQMADLNASSSNAGMTSPSHSRSELSTLDNSLRTGLAYMLNPSVSSFTPSDGNKWSSSNNNKGFLSPF